MLVSSSVVAPAESENTHGPVEGKRPRVPRRRRSANGVDAEQERALVRDARQGDERAFRKLVEAHRPRAFAVALRLLRDENDAEEVVQEAFFRAFRNLHRFDGQSSFFTWLYRIVKNIALDLLRKPIHVELEPSSARMLSHEDLAPGPSSRIDAAEPFDGVWRRELGAELEKALAALPPYHREVILMCAIEEMTYEEMAQTVQVSRGTIMSRLFHARRKLRRALAARHLEERNFA